jgi:hypothetical protein
MITSIFLLILLGMIAWFWFDTLQCQERAKIICKHKCRELNLQLLDDTIALRRVRLKRNSRGRLNLQRMYQFDFFEGGNTRQQGTIIMLGIFLEILEIPGYIQRTISPV